MKIFLGSLNLSKQLLTLALGSLTGCLQPMSATLDHVIPVWMVGSFAQLLGYPSEAPDNA